jgi:hypothetical protein
MCAPDLGEEGWKKIEKWEHLPANWPDHFDATIFLLNNCILRALDHTPNELFYGMVINTTATGVEAASKGITVEDVEAQLAYTQQQRLDGHARAVAHGVARKAAFDNRVLGSKAGEVIYKPGDLVQVLDPKFKKTFLTVKKILPEWSGAFRIKERILNSYVIETIYGQELEGKYNARRLRPFKAPEGSSLEAYEMARKAELEEAGEEGDPEKEKAAHGERTRAMDDSEADEDEDEDDEDEGSEDGEEVP